MPRASDIPDNPNPPPVPKRKRRITHSSAKAKGRNLQNWTAKVISRLTGIPWGKDELIAPRPMGQSGVDVALIGPAKLACPLSIECKNQEKWGVPGWIDQAKANEMPNTDWMLIIKSNRREPVAVMDAKLALKLVIAVEKRK